MRSVRSGPYGESEYVEDESAAFEEDVDISGEEEEPPDEGPGYTYDDDDLPGESANDGDYRVSDM